MLFIGKLYYGIIFREMFSRKLYRYEWLSLKFNDVLRDIYYFSL